MAISDQHANIGRRQGRSNRKQGNLVNNEVYVNFAASLPVPRSIKNPPHREAGGSADELEESGDKHLCRMRRSAGSQMDVPAVNDRDLPAHTQAITANASSTRKIGRGLNAKSDNGGRFAITLPKSKP